MYVVSILYFEFCCYTNFFRFFPRHVSVMDKIKLQFHLNCNLLQSLIQSDSNFSDRCLIRFMAVGDLMLDPNDLSIKSCSLSSSVISSTIRNVTDA